MVVRSGEAERTWFRSERIMHVNDQWFFVTREMTQEGPFGSRHEAEMELNLYIRHVNDDLYKDTRALPS
ncbi:MAG: DUF6316 family protein [Oleiphilaceae bacterium]|nr:DUF6316 family protein [Oleiphilaceae bacterium]